MFYLNFYSIRPVLFLFYLVILVPSLINHYSSLLIVPRASTYRHMYLQNSIPETENENELGTEPSVPSQSLSFLFYFDLHSNYILR